MSNIRNNPCGFLFVLKTSPRLAVSASDIRTALGRGQRPADLLPAVFDYIRQHGLYNRTENTPDRRGR